MVDFLYLGLYFFILGISGIFLFRNNIIFILICLELLSLSISIWISFFSIYLDNLFGQAIIFYILLTAAIEVAFGLTLVIVLFFNLKVKI